MDTSCLDTLISVETCVVTIALETCASAVASRGLSRRRCVVLRGEGVGALASVDISWSMPIVAAGQSGAGAMPLMCASTARLDRASSRMTSRSAHRNAPLLVVCLPPSVGGDSVAPSYFLLFWKVVPKWLSTRYQCAMVPRKPFEDRTSCNTGATMLSRSMLWKDSSPS